MIIGEVVETLIGIKRNDDIYRKQMEAINEACNILSKLPRMEEAIGYEPKQDRLV